MVSVIPNYRCNSNHLKFLSIETKCKYPNFWTYDKQDDIYPDNLRHKNSSADELISRRSIYIWEIDLIVTTMEQKYVYVTWYYTKLKPNQTDMHVLHSVNTSSNELNYNFQVYLGRFLSIDFWLLTLIL